MTAADTKLYLYKDLNPLVKEAGSLDIYDPKMLWEITKLKESAVDCQSMCITHIEYEEETVKKPDPQTNLPNLTNLQNLPNLPNPTLNPPAQVSQQQLIRSDCPIFNSALMNYNMLNDALQFDEQENYYNQEANHVDIDLESVLDLYEEEDAESLAGKIDEVITKEAGNFSDNLFVTINYPMWIQVLHLHSVLQQLQTYYYCHASFDDTSSREGTFCFFVTM